MARSKAKLLKPLQGRPRNMWIEKLTEGVLELDTPIGPRYVELNFAQRAYLLWTFRNFFSLFPTSVAPVGSSTARSFIGRE